jgi:transcriptional regulator with XRE-family HTH domain
MGLNVTGSPALANVLRTHRERIGLTQNALAKAVRIHTSTIWKIEAGQRGIGLVILNRLAEELGEDFKVEAESMMTDAKHLW